MILLALGLFLLLTGSGEAGEKVITWAEPECSNEACKQRGDTCYQRMQEAMKEMDERLEHFNGFTEGCPRDHYCEKIEQRFVEGTKLSRLWREVVNNCVKETP